MNERRMQIWIMVGGLALAALFLFAGNVVASYPASSLDAAALQDTTSWNSGWVDVATDTAVTFTHNLGGNPDDYAVELWFRDTDTGGIGINSFGAGGLEAGGNFLGAHWQELTDTTVEVVRRRDDTFADQVRVRIWIPDPPVWDSQWVDIAPGALETLTHNLGGDVDDYVVGLWFKDTTPDGMGINVRCYGGMEAAGQLRGAAWQNFTDTTIDVWRYPNDGWADQVRVRIFAPDLPDWDSGWVDVAAGTVDTLTHSLGGDPNHYIVRGWQRDTDGGIGINHRFVGGFEVGGSLFGSNWAGLTDETINVLRRPNDLVADQVRVRIWVKEFPVEPGSLSATLGVGQQEEITLTINNTDTDPLTFEIREQVPITATEFLLLDHGRDKTFFDGHSYDTVSEAEFAALSAEEMGQYRAVYLEPSWSDYGSLNLTNLAAYVQAGGVAVINIAGNIGSADAIDPAGTDYHRTWTHNAETILLSEHPYITGQPYGGSLLTTSDFNSWGSTDHGWLTGYPSDSQVVLQNTDGPSWLQYPYGSGQVIVTTLTYGWGGGGGRGAPLENLVEYALDLSGIPWLDESPVTGTVAAGESQPVTATFDASGLAPGVYTADLMVDISDLVSTVITVPVTMNVTEFGLSPSTKDVDLDIANPGDRLTYSIVLANAEATPINAVLTDTIPVNTTYVADSATGGATYNAAEDRIEWSGTVPGSGSQTITFQVDVNAPLHDHAAVFNTVLIEDLTNGIGHWRQVTTDIEAPVLTGSYKYVTPEVVSPGDTLTFTVFMLNTGSADAVGVTMQDPIPDYATYVADSVTGGATYNAAQDRVEWEGTIAAGGSTTVTFQVTADPTTRGLPIINRATISHPWAYTTYEYAAAGVLTGADILVVEDDYTGTDVRDTYTEALEANGYTSYDFFPADYIGTPLTTTLRSYPVVIWYTGVAFRLGTTDRDAIADYLSNGGRLFITGQDNAEETKGSDFLRDTLHISFVQDAPSGDKGVVGISGEILEVISATIDTYDPDIIEPADSLAVPIIEYTGVTTGTAGVRFAEDNSHGVFLGFEFEAVTEQTEREEVMGRIMGWLYGSKVYLPLVLKAYTSETELAYDDGAMDTNTSWETGKGFAVRFTPPADQAQLMRARYYLQDPRPIEVHVWDENHNDLIAPFTANTGQDGWNDVDLSAYNLTVSGDFYVGFFHLEDYRPTLGIDTTSADDRSFEVDGEYWEQQGSDYMIRAVVVEQ